MDTRMANVGVLLSHIQTANNIQLFLLENSLAKEGGKGGDGHSELWTDVLKLSKYIDTQCKLAVKEAEPQVKELKTTPPVSSLLGSGSASNIESSVPTVDFAANVKSASTEPQSTCDTDAAPMPSIITTPPHQHSTATDAALVPRAPSPPRSTGFDRLLTKMFSPSRCVQPQGRAQQQQKQQQQEKNYELGANGAHSGLGMSPPPAEDYSNNSNLISVLSNANTSVTFNLSRPPSPIVGRRMRSSSSRRKNYNKNNISNSSSYYGHHHSHQTDLSPSAAEATAAATTAPAATASVGTTASSTATAASSTCFNYKLENNCNSQATAGGMVTGSINSMGGIDSESGVDARKRENAIPAPSGTATADSLDDVHLWVSSINDALKPVTGHAAVPTSAGDGAAKNKDVVRIDRSGRGESAGVQNSVVSGREPGPIAVDAPLKQQQQQQQQQQKKTEKKRSQQQQLQLQLVGGPVNVVTPQTEVRRYAPPLRTSTTAPTRAADDGSEHFVAVHVGGGDGGAGASDNAGLNEKQLHSADVAASPNTNPHDKKGPLQPQQQNSLSQNRAQEVPSSSELPLPPPLTGEGSGDSQQLFRTPPRKLKIKEVQDPHHPSSSNGDIGTYTVSSSSATSETATILDQHTIPDSIVSGTRLIARAGVPATAAADGPATTAEVTPYTTPFSTPMAGGVGNAAYKALGLTGTGNINRSRPTKPSPSASLPRTTTKNLSRTPPNKVNLRNSWKLAIPSSGGGGKTLAEQFERAQY